MYNKMERTAAKKRPLNYIQGQVVPCHCCHIYGTWGSGEVEGSFSLNSVPELIEIESWMLLNFFISMKFYIFHCDVCLNVCFGTYV